MCWQGLVIPVLRNVERMNYADIEKELNALAEKVRRVFVGLVLCVSRLVYVCAVLFVAWAYKIWNVTE